MRSNNLIFDRSTAMYTSFMTALLHGRLSGVSRRAPALVPGRAVICCGCHHDSVPHLPVGTRGFCYVCLARSRSAADDDELGGEC
jgi:hypothetical protein